MLSALQTIFRCLCHQYSVFLSFFFFTCPLSGSLNNCLEIQVKGDLQCRLGSRRGSPRYDQAFNIYSFFISNFGKPQLPTLGKKIILF